MWTSLEVGSFQNCSPSNEDFILLILEISLNVHKNLVLPHNEISVQPNYDE